MRTDRRTKVARVAAYVCLASAAVIGLRTLADLWSGRPVELAWIGAGLGGLTIAIIVLAWGRRPSPPGDSEGGAA